MLEDNSLFLQSILLLMARDLNERDLEILKRLAPELEEMEREGIDIEYMNILPPVANHHSRGVADFEARLKKLSFDDMRYLTDMVLKGIEGLSCLDPDYAEAFFSVAGQRLSRDVAERLRESYESGQSSCG